MEWNETFRRVRCIHEPRRPRVSGTSQRHETAHRGRPQADRREPKQAWTEAKSSQTQEAFRLGPRFTVFVDLLFLAGFDRLAGHLGECQTLANDSRTKRVEAVTISHTLSVIEPKGLLIHVAEQMERFDTYVGAAQSALQEAPEVLQTVCMNVSLDVGFGVVDELVDIIGAESEVGVRFVGEQVRARFDVLLDRHIQTRPASIIQNGNTDLSSALQHGVNRNLADSAATFALHDALLAVIVHVANLAANEGLIDFDFAIQLAAVVVILHCQTNSLKHEPSSLLTDAYSPVEFPRAKPVLAVRELPHGEQPFIQANRRILEDRPDLDGELSLRVPSLALPEAPGRQETDLVRSTGRTDYFAIFPAPIRQIANAVLWIGEVNDCFLECFWFGCHDESSITQGA